MRQRLQIPRGLEQLLLGSVPLPSHIDAEVWSVRGQPFQPSWSSQEGESSAPGVLSSPMHLWPPPVLFGSWAFSKHCSVFNAFIWAVTDFQRPSCLVETKAKFLEVFCSHRTSVLGFTHLSVLTRWQMTAFLSCHVLFQGPCSVPEVKIKACWGFTTNNLS